jgi:hypothetical protein
MRIILAGFAGGIVMFLWTSIAHMATPLAVIGISALPDEIPVTSAMADTITHDGLYLFPRVDPADPKAMQKQAELRKTNPSGFLVYQKPGTQIAMGPMLAGEFAKETAQCIIAAVLLSAAALSGYFARAGFVSLIGAFAALGSDVSYYIWYAFPLSYTLASIAISLIGVIAGGFVMAALIKPHQHLVPVHS